jgi:hypothetical protein
MATREEYATFFLNSESSVVKLETLEITHSSFTRPYFIVRNKTDGLTATLENDVEQEFEYYPLQLTPLGNRDDLDQSISILFGDLGEIIPTELDAVAQALTFSEKPQVKYRAYRSDDLSEPLLGPVILEIPSFSMSREGASFEAKAPSLNANRTGELYKLARFPMLRSFIV